LMEELRAKREQLAEQIEPMVQKFYEKMGWDFNPAETQKPRLTVQGGIGNSGEQRRMMEYYGADATGWGTPFLLVPEATPVDEFTLEQLRVARKEDLYLSDASPLGVPFNNLRNSYSEQYMRQRYESGRPGSPCPKGFLVSNTEFTEVEICTASHAYQKQKLPAIDGMEPGSDKDQSLQYVLAKQCICDHLANSALIALGEARPSAAPQAVCPGPNLAWFNELYSLRQMIDHIYGRIDSLVPQERPHMFAAEVELYVDHFERLMHKGESTVDYMTVFRTNLLDGMEYCINVAKGEAYGDENLASIPPMVQAQRERLEALWIEYQSRIAVPAAAQ
jgi:hypothetical protein